MKKFFRDYLLQKLNIQMKSMHLIVT